MVKSYFVNEVKMFYGFDLLLAELGNDIWVGGECWVGWVDKIYLFSISRLGVG